MRLTRRGYYVLFLSAFTVGIVTANWSWYGGWQ